MFRYAPHDGEEPPVSGIRGSGTLFLSHCTLRCLYCQNYPWSQQGQGDVYSPPALDHALRALARHGCHNWNLVSPTPWLPMLHASLARVRDEGWRLPVVYNTSGYERVETLDAYEEDIQIYLSDLRYARAETALAASGAGDYVASARRAMVAMWQKLGALRLDENGIALSGVICRILVLPGHSREAIENVRWLAETLGTDVAISIMAQYRPAWKAVELAPWNRTVTREEYESVCEAVTDAGFETGWMQEPDGGAPDGLVGHDMPAGGFDSDDRVLLRKTGLTV